MFGVHIDITEKKVYEENLLRQKDNAEFQRSKIASLLVDPAMLSLNPKEIFRKIAKILSETIDVERSSIWTLSEDGTELVCQELYQKSTGEHSMGHRLMIDTFPSYIRAIEKEGRMYADDAQNDSRTKELAKVYLKPLGITSLLDCGIIIDGKVKGVISCEHIGKKRSWHSDEEGFIGILAALAGQILVSSEKEKRPRKSFLETQNDINLSLIIASALSSQ
jgi:GAF domain-containing protein